MKAIDAIKQAAKTSGMPTTHIGPALGMSTPYISTFSSKQRTPRCDTLAKILSTCGYKLCAVPEDIVTDDMIVID